MTHHLNIKPHQRECCCPAFWAEFAGHSPACNRKHAADFRALVAATREQAQTAPATTDRRAA